MNFASNCLQPVGCSAMPDNSFPLVTLQSMTATLDPSSDAIQVTGNWTEQAALIGWTVTCPQGTSHIAMIPGRPSSFGPVPIGFGVLNVPHTVGDDRNYIKYELTVANDPTCAP
jgi:hypothetical protein